MTDEQLKEITDRLDAIQSLMQETLKAMGANSLKVQDSIAEAAGSITSMQLIYPPPDADDIAQAVARALMK